MLRPVEDVVLDICEHEEVILEGLESINIAADRVVWLLYLLGWENRELVELDWGVGYSTIKQVKYLTTRKLRRKYRDNYERSSGN